MDGTWWCKLRIKQMSYRYKYIDYTIQYILTHMQQYRTMKISHLYIIYMYVWHIGNNLSSSICILS